MFGILRYYILISSNFKHFKYLTIVSTSLINFNKMLDQKKHELESKI